MIIPFFSSRMEQCGNLLRFRINSGQVWTLVEIAINASESDIVQVIGATVDFRNDMFDVK
jgi:hypothetical protein